MRKSLRLPVALVVVGLLLAVPAGVALVVRSVRAIDARSMATPGTTQRHLSAGTYVVFERTGTRAGFGGFSVSNLGSPELQPADVTVTAPDGSQVPVGFVQINETLTRGSGVYTGVLQFSAPAPGTYTIAVAGPQLEVIVTRSLNEALKGILTFVAIGGIGGLLVLIGLVVLIVRAVHNNRIPKYAMAGPAITPAGWYPDPSGQRQLRWWDGNRWTEHST